jgi:hypothetical protein
VAEGTSAEFEQVREVLRSNPELHLRITAPALGTADHSNLHVRGQGPDMTGNLPQVAAARPNELVVRAHAHPDVFVPQDVLLRLDHYG